MSHYTQSNSFGTIPNLTYRRIPLLRSEHWRRVDLNDRGVCDFDAKSVVAKAPLRHVIVIEINRYFIIRSNIQYRYTTHDRDWLRIADGEMDGWCVRVLTWDLCSSWTSSVSYPCRPCRRRIRVANLSESSVDHKYYRTRRRKTDKPKMPKARLFINEKYYILWENNGEKGDKLIITMTFGRRACGRVFDDIFLLQWSRYYYYCCCCFYVSTRTHTAFTLTHCSTSHRRDGSETIVQTWSPPPPPRPSPSTGGSGLVPEEYNMRY